jgi:hypothetical protein
MGGVLPDCGAGRTDTIEDSVDCTCKYGKVYYVRMLRFYDSFNPYRKKTGSSGH